MIRLILEFIKKWGKPPAVLELDAALYDRFKAEMECSKKWGEVRQAATGETFMGVPIKKA